MRVLRLILPILVPILSLAYSLGDYFNWWDQLRGRTIASAGIQELSSPSGFPDIIIYDDETNFESLLKLILNKTKNKNVVELYKAGKVPTAIFRLGGTLKPDVGGKLPPNWPNPRFAPSSSPVAVAYGFDRSVPSIDKEDVEPIGQLGDLRDWIVESRNKERFVVASILIGLLSIAVVVLDLTRSRSD